MYRPPDSSLYLHNDFNDHLTHMLSLATSEGLEVIIVGDVNVNYLKQNDNVVFKNIMRLYGFYQLVKEATRICETTSTLIDIIATNNPISIQSTMVIPTSFSDHDLICCVRKLNHMKFKPREITCRDYSKYDPKAMNDEISSSDWCDIYSTDNVNSVWENLSHILRNIFNRHAPIIKKRVKGKPAPWLTPNIKAAMNERDKLLRKYRKTNSDFDRRAYQNKRNQVNITLRKSKSSYNKKLLKESSSQPDKFWKTLKNIYPSKVNKNDCIQSFDINGEKCSDKTSIANGFRDFFSSITTKLKNKAMPLCNYTWRCATLIHPRTYKTFHFREVSIVEVSKILKSLERKKATGIDNLPASLLKDGANTIAVPLAYLINLSIQTGMIPNEWKIARIIPLYKSGSKSSFDNYRPISILPVISKIIEKIIHKQFMDFLEENKLLYKNQFGFRSKMSTEQAAILFIDEIRSNVDKGNLVGSTFIDLSKAFDTISHSQLIAKLPMYGVHDRELCWFIDYLFHRQAVVQYDSSVSDKMDVLSGVPTGIDTGSNVVFVNF